MKRSVRLLVFSRAERMGMVALCCMIVVMVIIRAAVHFGNVPAVDKTTQAWLVASAHQFGYDRSSANRIRLPEHQDKNGGYTVPLPDTVDINTADSATLVQLVGIGPATAHNILMRRAKRPLMTFSELSEVGSFGEQTVDILKKHLKFMSSRIK